MPHDRTSQPSSATDRKSGLSNKGSVVHLQHTEPAADTALQTCPPPPPAPHLCLLPTPKKSLKAPKWQQHVNAGFMSNRGRQNVASYLVLDMGVDWRQGADWFETVLQDYDVCSNWGNWVAAAGFTGGRINHFNIAKQSKVSRPVCRCMPSHCQFYINSHCSYYVGLRISGSSPSLFTNHACLDALTRFRRVPEHINGVL